MARFDYFEPDHLDELLDLLARYGEDARVIAGGQSLLILIRQGLVRPGVLISLDKLSSLRQISDKDNEIILGAMVTQSDVSAADRIRERLAVLFQAASKVGSVHVQNLGTVGGNLCHAEPNGDSAPALLSAGASIRASSSRRERKIRLEDFFRGPFENALEPDEALTHIHVPIPASGASSVYLKHVLRAVDRATVSVGLMMQMDREGRCQAVRIGLGGAASTPIRAKQAEALLQGEKITESVIEAAGMEVSRNCDPLSDAHGPAEYKRKMAGLLTKRAIRQVVGAHFTKQEV
jgi:carbon-monoxide dehydrogenase medium subunit